MWKLHPRAHLEANEGEDGGGTLFDSYTATLFVCNQTAWALVNVLVSGADAQALVPTLVEQFEVSDEEAAMDIRSFIYHIQSMGLIDG